MVHFETLLEAAQNGDGVLHGWRLDQDWLEAPLQGRVFFDVLAVFVERGGADAVQFAAGQHGLEHVAGVRGPFGAAGAHDGVDFVDEQDDASRRGLDFIQDRFESLFEFTAILGASHERRHIEGEDGAVLESFGHIAAHDAVGQAFDDRRLPHAGFADQHGIVLCLARQDADDAADFLVAADHRVQLALASHFNQVAAVLLERLVGSLGIRARHPLIAADSGQRLQKAFAIQSRLSQKLARKMRLAFVKEGQQ